MKNIKKDLLCTKSVYFPGESIAKHTKGKVYRARESIEIDMTNFQKTQRKIYLVPTDNPNSRREHIIDEEYLKKHFEIIGEGITKDDLLKMMQKLSLSNGMLQMTKGELAKEAGFNRASDPKFIKYLQELEKECKIMTAQKTKNLGCGRWTPCTWIVEKEKKEDKNVITETFHNINVRLVKKEGQYYIPVNDICDSIGYDRVAGRQLIERNKELFKGFCSDCVMQSEAGKRTNLVLSRDGVVGFLMKISYNRLSNYSKGLVLEFQKWAITKLTELIVNGKVEAAPAEQKQIQNILQINDEKFNKLFSEIKSNIIEIDKYIDTMKNQRNNAVKSNEKYITQLIDLKNMLYSRTVGF